MERTAEPGNSTTAVTAGTNDVAETNLKIDPQPAVDSISTVQTTQPYLNVTASVLASFQVQAEIKLNSTETTTQNSTDTIKEAPGVQEIQAAPGNQSQRTQRFSPPGSNFLNTTSGQFVSSK